MTESLLDAHTIVDVLSVVLSVLGGYFAAMRRLDTRLKAIEIQVAILLDRDRRKRLTDYENEGVERT